MRASRVSAGYGARVAIAESDRFGGTCVNVGCIPKKLFSYAAHFREEFEIAARLSAGPSGEPKLRLAHAARQQGPEIARLNGDLRARAARSPASRSIAGRATVARSARRSRSNGKTHTAKHILVATGSWPVIPPIPGREHAITSERGLPPRAPAEARAGGRRRLHRAGVRLDLPRPRRETTLSYRGKRLLRGFDAELGDAHRRGDGGEGRRRCTSAASRRRSSKAARWPRGRYTDGRSQKRTWCCSPPAGGPNTASLGLEQAGVKLARRWRGGRRRVFAHQRRVDPRHRRRHQPHQPHAGRHRRGDVARAHAVPRRADAGRPRERADGGVRASEHRAPSASPRRRRASATARSTSTRRTSAPLKLTLDRAARSAPS